MRKKIVAGNWKMNNNHGEAIQLVKELKQLSYSSEVQLIVVPPFPFIHPVAQELTNSSISIGAQNCATEDKGAYTGEVSASMLNSVGANYIIIGHSERRSYYAEKNDGLAKKVDQTLKNNLVPIYCCGELLEQRENGDHFDVVKTQIREGLFHLSEQELLNCVIAYEPVWAIGTGVTASPDQAQEMHAVIRDLLTTKYSAAIANQISILYGGSCNPKNAKELFALADVDGGLIGGASLKSEDFIAIANSF